MWVQWQAPAGEVFSVAQECAGLARLGFKPGFQLLAVDDGNGIDDRVHGKTADADVALDPARRHLGRTHVVVVATAAGQCDQ